MSWEDHHDPRRRAAASIPRNAALADGPRRDPQRGATRARGGSASRWPPPASPAPTKARCSYVTSERLVSRTHFARFLVEAGHAREMKDVFKRYLVAGQARLRRARVGDAAAGGRLDPRGGRPGGARASGTLQGRPPAACGGCSASSAMPAATAIEVLSPSHTPAQFAEFATLRARLRLARVRAAPTTTARRELARPGRPAAAAGRRRPGLDATGNARAGSRRTMPDRRTVFFISDRTGITAEMLGNSLLVAVRGLPVPAA